MHSHSLPVKPIDFGRYNNICEPTLISLGVAFDTCTRCYIEMFEPERNSSLLLNEGNAANTLLSYLGTIAGLDICGSK
jgi:hypothetical protein